MKERSFFCISRLPRCVLNPGSSCFEEFGEGGDRNEEAFGKEFGGGEEGLKEEEEEFAR